MRTPKQEHSSLEYASLGLIRNGVCYGYEIFKQMSDTKGLGQVWLIKPANLYAILSKMEAANWLKAKVTSAGNRPPRKEYSLTSEGERIFEEWCFSIAKHPREMRQDFLVRWYFIRGDKKKSEKLIQDQIGECNLWEAGLHSKKSEVGASDWFESTLYQFRINQIRGIKTWLEQLQRGEK